MKNNLFIFAMLASLAFGLTLTACGPSKAVLAIQQTATIEEVQGLTEKLTWLEANAQSGGSYVIELDRDDAVNFMVRGGSFFEGTLGVISNNKGDLYYKDKKDITITLKSVDTNRTIESYEGLGVGSGVTLILDNITLKGRDKIVYNGPNNPERHGTLVSVSSGGTLVMNDGSAIIDNINITGNGGGVHVSGGGTFIMKGGIITNNASIYRFDEWVENGQIVFNYHPVFGGGVYVEGSGNLWSKAAPSATFIKTGGTITGYASDTQEGNRAMDAAGKAINGNGHAIYFEGARGIDVTIGPDVNLEFKDGVLKEGKVETISTSVAPVATPAAQVTKEAVPAVQQQTMSLTQQKALQEYQDTAQKIKEKQQAAILEYLTTPTQNSAEQQEATQKYQKTLQETQQEKQEAVKKYQETMQKR